MRLTINIFKECLKHPAVHLTSMRDAEVKCDSSRNPEIWRTTHFAEAEISFNGDRYLLCMPLSEEAHLQCLNKCVELSRILSPCLTTYTILAGEMMFVNREGKKERIDLLLHRLPEGDTLYNFAEFASRETLLEAIGLLENEFRKLKITHNNLTPHNIIVDDNYSLTPIRYYYCEREIEESACGEEFDRLREWVNTVVDLEEEEQQRLSTQNVKLPESLFSGYKSVSHPFEELICVEDNDGYMYVNIDNEVIIPGRFKWAGDFHEGRAEVESENGMGLINKEGNFIIPAIYKIVDYDVTSGLSRVRLREKWALFGYNGEQILPFENRYIDDEDLEILSI